MGRLRGIAAHRYPPDAPPPSPLTLLGLMWVWDRHRHALEKGCGQETLERYAATYPRSRVKTVDGAGIVTISYPYNPRNLRRGLQWLCLHGGAYVIPKGSGCTAYRLDPHRTGQLIRKIEGSV